MTVHHMQNLCLAAILGLPLISLSFVMLRFWIKRKSSQALTLDDWLLLIANIFFIVEIYPGWRLTFMFHYGVHIWEVHWRDDQLDVVANYRLNLVFGIFNSMVLPLVKASMIILLLRVGGILQSLRKVIYVVFAFNAILGVIPMFFILFQCPPLADQTWKPRTFGNLRCAGGIVIGRVFLFQVCANMFTDLLIFPIPVYLTWKLQKASFRSRLIVFFSFALSLGATAIGAVRIYLTYKQHLYRSVPNDWTYPISFSIYYLENATAIVFACVPSLRLLVVGIIKKGDSRNRSRYGDLSYGHHMNTRRSSFARRTIRTHYNTTTVDADVEENRGGYGMDAITKTVTFGWSEMKVEDESPSRTDSITSLTSK